MPPSSSSASWASSSMRCWSGGVRAASPGPIRCMKSPWVQHEKGVDMTAGRRIGEVVLGILPVAMVIALWHGIAVSGIAPAVLLPPPGAVFTRLIHQIGDPNFLSQVGITLFRLFAGFSIALVVGVTLGVAATGSKTFESVIKPLVRVLAPLPKVALYPAMVLILGFDDASKIALLVADAVFPILLATYQGTSAVEPKLVRSAPPAGTSQPT